MKERWMFSETGNINALKKSVSEKTMFFWIMTPKIQC